MQIEIILVGWAWSAVPAIFQTAFELREHVEVFPKMHIGMNHVTFKQITAVVLRPASPEAVVIVLVSFPDFAAERQIPIAVGGERDEFYGIEIIRWLRRVAE